MFGFQEELFDGVPMDGSLGETFGDDGRLFPFHAVHELDQGVEEAREETHEHVVGEVVAFEEILGDDGFPALGLNLALEEAEEVGIVLLLAEVAAGVVPCLDEVLDDRLVGWEDGALVVVVLIVAFLEGGWASASSVESEDVMGDLSFVNVGAEVRVRGWRTWLWNPSLLKKT